MQGLLTRVIVITILAAGMAAIGQVPGYAGTKCQQTDPVSGRCTIWVSVPTTEQTSTDTSTPSNDPNDTGAGASCYWDPAKQGLAGPPAGPVPCQSKSGYWSNATNCYVRALDPQPAANDPAWQGHRPGDGALYSCFQPQTDMFITTWAATPPPGAAAGPSPREVAQMAVDQMNLSAIDIGITPEPGADSVGLVGMPVWLWVQDPDEHTYGPATASASAGGITIDATARTHEITWDLGDGTTKVCRGPGTPYQPRFGKKTSPTCGHVYTRSSIHQPEQKYTVTATSSWVITWEGAGQTGTIRLGGLSRSVQITVGEAQVLVN